MLLVIRRMLDRKEKKEYKLKKLDIVKLGRIKFKVRAINIMEKNKAKEELMKKMKRREDAWVLKERERLMKE